MKLAASPEQRQFAEAIRDLLAASDLTAVNRDWAAGNPAPGLAVWRRLADLGVTALAIPPSFGGLTIHAQIRPELAGELIIGGLPRSRLPRRACTRT